MCALTHLGDTCTALAAIAKEFHRLGYIQSDYYFPSLWTEHLQDHRDQLLWSAIINQRKNRGHNTRSLVYLVPSVDHPINVQVDLVYHTWHLFELSKRRPILISDYPFGLVSGGSVCA